MLTVQQPGSSDVFPSIETTGVTRQLPDAIRLGVAFLVLYGATVFPTPPPVGDAADYTRMLREGILPDRMAGHVGYYLLLRPIVAGTTALGLSATLVTHLIAACAMAGAMALAYVIFRHLTLGRRVAVIATCFLGVSGLFWYNALFAEVTALCIVLMFASTVLFLRGRPGLAGGSFGLALLVTQLAAPWAVVFPFLAAWKREWKPFVLATAAGTAVFALGIIPVAHEYFYGPRGVFTLGSHTQPVPMAKFTLYFGYRMLESFTVVAPLMIVGGVAAVRRHRWLMFLTLLVGFSSAVISLRSTDVEYGVTWIPALLPLAALGALGIDFATGRLVQRRHRLWIEASVVAATVILTWSLFVRPKRVDAIRFAREAASLADIIGHERVAAGPEAGMAYVGVTQSTTGDVWRSNWVMAPTEPSEWVALVGDAGTLHAFTVRPRPHLFRRWLFDNAIARRFLDERQRAQYTAEHDSSVEEAVRTLGARRRVDVIYDTGYLRAWRIHAVRTSH